MFNSVDNSAPTGGLSKDKEKVMIGWIFSETHVLTNISGIALLEDDFRTTHEAPNDFIFGSHV